MATILHLRVFSDAELLPLAAEALSAELGPEWQVVVAEKEPSLSLSLDRDQDTTTMNNNPPPSSLARAGSTEASDETVGAILGGPIEKVGGEG